MSKKSEAKVVSRKEMTKAQWTLHLMNVNKIGYFMIAPFMILFFLFTIIPVALSLVLSLTNFNMIEFPDFVFLQNYATLFLDDELFITALKNTMIFAVVVGPAGYVISFVTAWFINELDPKIRALVTFVFYAPSISYFPEYFGGLSAKRFCQAVTAECNGTYTCWEGANYCLHTHNFFKDFDLFNVGKPTRIAFSDRDVREDDKALAPSDNLYNVSAPWFKNLDKEWIDKVVEGYKKVAENYKDLLEGDDDKIQGGRWHGAENAENQQKKK